MKLKRGLRASYTIWPSNKVGLFYSPGARDFPAFTPAEAGTRFSDPRGKQGWVDHGEQTPI